ncbi:MAG: FecCD family ABC transporter permease [bacterium]
MGVYRKMARKDSNKQLLRILLGLVAPVFTLALSAMSGRYHISFSSLIKQLLGGASQPDQEIQLILLYGRLPRSLLALITGGSLSVAGLILQGTFQNPLVSPDIIGVTAGASFGAALAIVAWDLTLVGVQFWAFACGLIATIAAFLLARATGQRSTANLVLAGIIVNALCSAGVSLLKYVADPFQKLPSLEFWLMGGFYTSTWEDLGSVILPLSLGIGTIWLLRWQLNLLAQGEEVALSLGSNVSRVRFTLVMAAAILVAAGVSVAGMVGWIGLVGPHIVRLLVGNDYSKNLLLSFSIGGSLLLLADILARTITSAEIPISIVTALVGAPCLAYLLRKAGRGFWL